MTSSAEAGGEADRLAFERCFRDHYADVLAFSLRRVRERQVAEDVAAETFAVVWRRRQLVPEATLPWLYGIAAKVIANQRRSSRRRWNLEQSLAREVAASASETDPIGVLDRRSAFAAAFQRLSDDERDVLSLIAWEGLDTREAAAALGCSHGAFRVRLHRARRKLAKHLAGAGHILEKGPPATPKPSQETT